MRGKLQIPNSKFQTSSKFQAANSDKSTEERSAGRPGPQQPRLQRHCSLKFRELLFHSDLLRAGTSRAPIASNLQVHG
jgi:hypothetical protein